MLHDMIEDGGETVKSLIEKGVHPFIAERVQLVSKGNEQNDKDYLDTVATDPIACEVKLAELKHNMDWSRLNEVTEEDRVKAEHYQKVYDFLIRSQTLKYAEQFKRKYIEPRLLQPLPSFEPIDDSEYIPTTLYSLIWYKRVKDILPLYDEWVFCELLSAQLSLLEKINNRCLNVCYLYNAFRIKTIAIRTILPKIKLSVTTELRAASRRQSWQESTVEEMDPGKP